MSRVEENAKIRKDVSEAIEDVIKSANGLLGNEKVRLVNSAKMTLGITYLEDISSSLAVIADGITGEKSHSNPVTLIEDKFKENGITSKEWDIWVSLREKYIFGKNIVV